MTAPETIESRRRMFFPGLRPEDESLAEKPAEAMCSGQLTCLVDEIETTHHPRLRRQLLAMTGNARCEASADRNRSSTLSEMALEQLLPFLQRLHVALEWHMAREEDVLFPLCRTLDTARELPVFPGRTVRVLIKALIVEHSEIQHNLEKIQGLTRGFDAVYCDDGGRCIVTELTDLAEDIHQYVVRERDQLFPLAVDAENRLKCEG